MLDGIEDRQLVKGILKGHEKSIAIIRNWVSIVLNKMIKLGVINEQEREDLIQETLREVWKNLQSQKYRYESSLKTYVWSVAKFVCLQYGRRRAKRAESLHRYDMYSLVDRAPDPFKRMEQSEQEKIFVEAKRLAPEKCRELWRMLFEENMDYQEIAQAMGVSYGNVRVGYTRCKERLMKIVQEVASAKAEMVKLSKAGGQKR